MGRARARCGWEPIAASLGCSIFDCFVFVGALLVGRGVGELDASTDVVVVVAPNLVRDPLSHPCRLQSDEEALRASGLS